MRCPVILVEILFSVTGFEVREIANHMLIEISAASPLLSIPVTVEFYISSSNELNIRSILKFRELNLFSFFVSFITQSMFCCVCVMIFFCQFLNQIVLLQNEIIAIGHFRPRHFVKPAKLFFFFLTLALKYSITKATIKFHITSSVASSRGDNYWKKNKEATQSTSLNLNLAPKKKKEVQMVLFFVENDE